MMSKNLNLTLGLTFVSFYLSIITAVLHNVISGIMGKEEPIFFSLTMIAGMIFPFALIAASIVWVVQLRRDKKSHKK